MATTSQTERYLPRLGDRQIDAAGTPPLTGSVDVDVDGLSNRVTDLVVRWIGDHETRALERRRIGARRDPRFIRDRRLGCCREPLGSSSPRARSRYYAQTKRKGQRSICVRTMIFACAIDVLVMRTARFVIA